MNSGHRNYLVASPGTKIAAPTSASDSDLLRLPRAISRGKSLQPRRVSPTPIVLRAASIQRVLLRHARH